jgi:hypothetical protein
VSTEAVAMADQADPGAERERGETAVPADRWQTLEARWKAIMALEATIDTLRMSVEGARAQLEGAARAGLNAEDKVHGLQTDVAQWTKAKNRVHFALPKAREFVHRATWALGVPERKKLEELIKTHVQPRVPSPELDHMPEQLDNLFKDRQVLVAQGNAVAQECRTISQEIQRALATLQRNAADNARRKRDAKREKR